MIESIKQFVGRPYIFKLDGMFMGGHFCGIGKVGEDYGMIFINVISTSGISKTSCLVIHPSRFKTTMYSGILQLRRSCRKIFQENHLQNNSKNIYYSIFEVQKPQLEMA